MRRGMRVARGRDADRATLAVLTARIDRFEAMAWQGCLVICLNDESVDGRLPGGWKVFGGVILPPPIVYGLHPRNICFNPNAKIPIHFDCSVCHTDSGWQCIWGSFTPLLYHFSICWITSNRNGQLMQLLGTDNLPGFASPKVTIGHGDLILEIRLRHASMHV